MTAPSREQTRARYPDESGYIQRDGVRVYYEAYGTGEPAILLLPTWEIVHSRAWKFQIPYFARHGRRGCPVHDASAYPSEHAGTNIGHAPRFTHERGTTQRFASRSYVVTVTPTAGAMGTATVTNPAPVTVTVVVQ